MYLDKYHAIIREGEERNNNWEFDKYHAKIGEREKKLTIGSVINTILLELIDLLF